MISFSVVGEMFNRGLVQVDKTTSLVLLWSVISACSGVSGSQAGGPLYLRNTISRQNNQSWKKSSFFWDICPENIVWQKSEKAELKTFVDIFISGCIPLSAGVE